MMPRYVRNANLGSETNSGLVGSQKVVRGWERERRRSVYCERRRVLRSSTVDDCERCAGGY